MPDFSWLQYPVTHGFYSAYDPNTPDTPHFAYDIGTPFHTTITALKSGVVKQSDYAAWGGEVFVAPDDGSTEYYVYHLDQNAVAAGQHVNAGDSLGLSGGENPGYPGALHPADPIWSTGPHTHVGLFTNYVSTPVGSRPQGPDIGPLLQSIKTDKTSINIGPGTPVNSTPVASIPTLDNISGGIESGMVRIGIFAMILLIFVAGFYVMFKDQINSGVKKSVELGKKAAETAIIA